jgi:hypothetical protein
VGKGSGKSDEAEEFNTWTCSKLATMVKSDREPVTRTLENDIVRLIELINGSCSIYECSERQLKCYKSYFAFFFSTFDCNALINLQWCTRKDAYRVIKYQQRILNVVKFFLC